MKNLVIAIAKSKNTDMITPTEAISYLKPNGLISVPVPISWADNERDLSAWLGNTLQRDAFNTLNSLKKDIIESGNRPLLRSWNYLQTSDHFFYMSTKAGDDGQIHNYFSPYPSPYEAFINYMNVLSDVEMRLRSMKKIPARRVPALC
ncbi:MAG: hypothetical protein WD824_20110 [Cyclobacteriaceae bacterium]